MFESPRGSEDENRRHSDDKVYNRILALPGPVKNLSGRWCTYFQNFRYPRPGCVHIRKIAILLIMPDAYMWCRPSAHSQRAPNMNVSSISPCAPTMNISEKLAHARFVGITRRSYGWNMQWKNSPRTKRRSRVAWRPALRPPLGPQCAPLWPIATDI